MSDGHSERGFGYWLSIFANLAVVAGIVFLGMEIRQNSEATRADIKNALSESSRYQGLWVAEHPEVLTLDQRWSAGEELSEVELLQVDALYYARWKNLENALSVSGRYARAGRMGSLRANHPDASQNDESHGLPR